MRPVGFLAIAWLGAMMLPSIAAGQQPSPAAPAAAPAPAPPPTPGPRLEDDGTVRYSPTLAIPFSGFASPEARDYLVASGKGYPAGFFASNPFSADRMMATRKFFDDQAKAGVEAMRTLYPVTVTQEVMGGIPTDVVLPSDGIASENANRVLINLHGGGFVFGARWIGLTESIPVASVGRIKVVTVDYRMGPEHKFPAASEDVAKVYTALLRQYRPENIGIFGCSAGGVLTMQSVAWFQAYNLPRPGAIGVFCAGGTLSTQGDSAYTGPILTGGRAPGLKAPQAPYRALYFRTGDEANPLAAPLVAPTMLAKYPPTLLISGTRDFALSGALATHRALINAGVNADLHVFDGLQHAFFYSPKAPESREVYALTARFFMKNLKNVRKGR